jgi:myo-inositol-1(or 4)-monophosphatase
LTDSIDFFRKLGKEAFQVLRSLDDPFKIVGTNPLGQKTMKADVALEDLAIERLKEAEIGKTLVTEEKGDVKLSGKSGVVVLDPLDGSNNYRRGVPSYGLIIGLSESNSYSGMKDSYIINLTNGDEYWARKGKGAFMNCKRIRTSQETSLDKCILEYDPNQNQILYDRILPLLKSVKDIRRFGANAVGLCYIAAGAHHFFIDLDNGLSVIHAPGLAITEEAGAVVTDAKGSSINPQLKVDAELSFVCSANAALHKKALKLIA